MSMDVNTLRTIIEVACFVIFLGIVAWAYSSRREADFRQAERLPLDHE